MCVPCHKRCCLGPSLDGIHRKEEGSDSSEFVMKDAFLIWLLFRCLVPGESRKSLRVRRAIEQKVCGRRPVFKTKMLICQSKSDRMKKNLFGKIKSLRPSNEKNACKGFAYKSKIPHSIVAESFPDERSTETSTKLGISVFC